MTRGRRVSALEEVRDLAEAVAHRLSLRLWDVEVAGNSGRGVVRVFVDSDQGVDLDTVAAVSEQLSQGLEQRDPLKGSYTLEVSSPGLERTLRTKEHFELSVGRELVVKTKRVVVGDGHRIEGVLVEAGAEGITIDAPGGPAVVPYELIKAARTVFNWK